MRTRRRVRLAPPSVFGVTRHDLVVTVADAIISGGLAVTTAIRRTRPLATVDRQIRLRLLDRQVVAHDQDVVALTFGSADGTALPAWHPGSHIDVHLPGGNAQEVLRQCHGEYRFLALSVSDASEDVIGVVRLGARGYVTKDISAEELASAIRQVAAGDAVFSPRLAGFVLDAFTGAVAASDDELDRLTARERDVMRLIARGYTYREAADELFVSVKTVETHMSAVLRKLQLSNRRELARWARDRGI